jgi:hypothetical protein
MLAIAAVPMASACGQLVIEGSGRPETTAIEVADFDRVEVSEAFHAEIAVQPGPPSVEITIDDNLVERLDVGVDGEVLRIGLRRGHYGTGVAPTAVVTAPSLVELGLSGASTAVVAGIGGEELAVQASGASRATLEIDVDHLDLDLSGASEAEATGTSETVQLGASGASRADLDGLSAATAEIELSGASMVDLGAVTSIDGTLSGASRLTAPRSAARSISTSGASTVEIG